MFFEISKDVLKIAEQTAKDMIDQNISNTRFKIANTPINMGLVRADKLDEESEKIIFSDIISFHGVDFYITR